MARRAVPARQVAGGTNNQATLPSEGIAPLRAPLHAARCPYQAEHERRPKAAIEMPALAGTQRRGEYNASSSEGVLKIARSGDRAYNGARIAVFPVGRVPSRGPFVDF